MAHASRSDALKNHMKNLRKKRANERAKWRALTLEEQEEILIKRHEVSIYDQAQKAIWDYNKKQYPPSKYEYLKEILNSAIEEQTIKEDFKIQCQRVLEEIK